MLPVQTIALIHWPAPACQRLRLPGVPRSLLIGHPCAFLWFKLLVTLDRGERGIQTNHMKRIGRDLKREGSVFSGARTAEPKRKETLEGWLWLSAKGEPPECEGETEGSRVSGQGTSHQFLGCGQSQLSLADVTHQCDMQHLTASSWTAVYIPWEGGLLQVMALELCVFKFCDFSDMCVHRLLERRTISWF